MDDKIQTNMASMFKQHFKELTSDPGAEDDTESNHTTPYKNFASIGHVRISERKHNTEYEHTQKRRKHKATFNARQSNQPGTGSKKLDVTFSHTKGM